VTEPGLAVVTGASSGIGLAFAGSLADRGHPVLLVARREDRLRVIAETLTREHGVSAQICVADLATPEGRSRCRDAVDAAGRPVEVAVLNAGFGTRGRLADLDREREIDEIQLNCLGVVDLGLHVLPGMVQRDQGALIVVSSAAGFLPIPHMATYSATKAFELRWTEALAGELRGTGVQAIAVCPGPTKTEFSTGAGGKNPYKGIPVNSADDVVAATWLALERGRSRISTGAVSRLTSVVTRVAPRGLVTRVAGVMHRPKGAGNKKR
jgi:uncharacterized protein